MCLRITDSHSIDDEKRTYGDGSAVEFVSRDHVRRRTFQCVYSYHASSFVL